VGELYETTLKHIAEYIVEYIPSSAESPASLLTASRPEWG